MGTLEAIDQNATLEQRLKLLEDKYSQLALQYTKLQEEKGATTGAKDSTEIQGSDGPIPNSVIDPVKTESNEGDRDAPEKPAPRIRVIHHVHDEQNGYRDQDPTEEATITKPQESGTVVLIRKDIADPEDSEIEILGEELRKLMRRTLAHSPIHWSLGELKTFNAPYENIIHNWDILKDESEKTDGSESENLARSDLKLLLETILQGSGDPKLDDYLKNRSGEKGKQLVTFDTLWTVFPPGTLVYAKPFLKQEQVLIVYDNAYPWPRENPRRGGGYFPWVLRCFTYDWDGSKFSRRVVRLTFDEFSGARAVAGLPVRPLNSFSQEEVDDIEKRLLIRGRLFQKYCKLPSGGRMLKYSGPAIIEKTGLGGTVTAVEKDDDDSSSYQQIPPQRMSAVTSPIGREANITGEVMVDFESYRKYVHSRSMMGKYAMDHEDGECDCADCRSNEALRKIYRSDFDDCTGDRTEEWDDLQYILCPPRVLGYVLRDKVWAQLDVTKLEAISSENAEQGFMQKLKLAGARQGEKKKKLLLGLVKNHGITEASRRDRNYELRDLVAEKGRGLVILLYGPPGVGKTSTAQTIAVAAGKPLLTVGVADVGTTAQHVERNLEKIFDLATTWGSVLLIDEADVFLQSRSRGELGSTTERNALVSVFLRVLEYYQGILILTTNQIAQFDVAVQSRIHVAIKYLALNEDQTKEIFDSFLQQFIDKDMVEPREIDKIKDWARDRLPRMKLDGRQIRNVITSAMGLAKADDNRKLVKDDLLDISDLVESFKDDLKAQMIKYEQSQEGNRGA